MRTLLFIFLMSVAHTALCQKVSLTVQISGFENNKGKVMVALYSNEESFLKKPTMGKVATIQNQMATVVFENVPIGTYAVSLFHDENNNNKLDANFIGIPSESYGASNNAKGFMGPPKFKDAKFALSSDKIIKIEL